MNTTKMLLALAGILLLASVGTARAGDMDNRQVWRDTEGQIVHNTFGNCVRSRWPIDHDPCADEAKGSAEAGLAKEDRTVYFAFDKSNLSDEARERLDTLADKLNASDGVTDAKIVGYADRIGTVSYNEALSKKRAETVRDYLIKRGFIKPSEAKTHWVGKSEPSTSCPADLPRDKLIECLAPDRKVQVDIDYRDDTTTD